MTMITNSVGTRPAPRFTNIFAGVSAFFAAVGKWNEHRATREVLSRLSDHELEDIGLQRSDIHNL